MVRDGAISGHWSHALRRSFLRVKVIMDAWLFTEIKVSACVMYVFWGELFSLVVTFALPFSFHLFGSYSVLLLWLLDNMRPAKSE